MDVSVLIPFYRQNYWFQAKASNRSYFDPLVDIINKAFSASKIDTPERAALFLANTTHETAGYKKMRESFGGYTAERIAVVWPTRFKGKDGKPNELAKKIMAHSQSFDRARSLANSVYNGRMGNREGTDDGWIYRGGGLPMLTGRGLYQEMDDYFHLEGRLVEQPHIIEKPHIAVMAGQFFWETKDMNKYADAGRIVDARKVWNVGHTNVKDKSVLGLSETVTLYNRILGVLKQHAS